VACPQKEEDGGSANDNEKKQTMTKYRHQLAAAAGLLEDVFIEHHRTNVQMSEVKLGLVHRIPFDESETRA